MSEDVFDKRRHALEEEFFKRKNQQLVEKLRATLERDQPRETIRALTGIQNEAVLDTLVTLHVNHDTLAAFALYPLVEVAWADGEVDDREREALLKAAAEHGIKPGPAAHEALAEFLREVPRDDARRAWRMWATELAAKLDGPERKTLREGLIQRARAVAEASGGFLGMGSRVSPKEQLVLDAIAAAFPD